MSDIRLDAAIFGADPTPRIVAVEAGQREATLFLREGDADVSTRTEVTTRTVPMIPWLIADQERFFAGAETTALEGEGHRFLIRFPEGWNAYQDARRALRDQQVEVVQYGSAVKQFLMASGHTLFGGMVFDDVVRMQVDIETTGLDPNDPAAGIFMISVSDNRGLSEVLIGDEATLLRDLLHLVQSRDPDVIEGHNIYSFDLPYLLARCAAHAIEPAFGRQGAAATVGTPRNCSIGPNIRRFTPIYLNGRHILDTLFQVQRFDMGRGQISSYGLKECAQTFGIAAPDRVYLDRSQITELYRTDPERVKVYARQDAEETAALAALTAPSEFYQSQMIPDGFQNIAVTGNGEKINSILVREYLRQGRSIPKQKESSPYPGGYTEVRLTGVVKPIVKADVESLYPSIMLQRQIAPESDTQGIFLPLLSDLTTRRLEAKAELKKYAPGTRDYAYWEGLQGSFKILINSFYGYIGGPFYFNDYKAARAVTAAGQTIVKQIAAELEERGARVVEIDTDGVYFKPPDGIATVEAERAFVELIGQSLPDGIRLAHDGSYSAMLSLKIKNYVLVEPNGHMIFKGSSLRSRADERFGRRFLTQAVDLMLTDRTSELSALYEGLLEQIQSGAMPIEQIAKRERVTDKLLNSDMRKRAASAVRDASVGHGEFVSLYQKSDKTLGMIEDYARDEDRDYYAAKLYKFATRLKAGLGDAEFDRLFKKPVAAAKRPDPNQMLMDL